MAQSMDDILQEKFIILICDIFDQIENVGNESSICVCVCVNFTTCIMVTQL